MGRAGHKRSLEGGNADEPRHKANYFTMAEAGVVMVWM